MALYAIMIFKYPLFFDDYTTLQYLRDCDSVTLMSEGQIIGHGNHQDLLNSNKVYLPRLLLHS